MFFLVPYKLIDREDLSIIQKMCILYLARHFDEKGALDPINELELAEKLRVSTSEIRLNLDVLLSKGIINIDNHLISTQNEDKDAKNIIVKEAVFKNLSTDSFEELKMKLNNKIKRDEQSDFSTTAKITQHHADITSEITQQHADITSGTLEPHTVISSAASEPHTVISSATSEPHTVISSATLAESRDLTQNQTHFDPSYIAELAKEDIFKEETPSNPEYDEVVAKINSAEEKIKERAAKLKLNVRKRDKRRRNSENTSQYNRRKTDRVEPENSDKPKEETIAETDELLRILSESNQTLLKEKKSLIDENYERFKNRPNRRKADVQDKRKNINPKFMKASSVYKQHGSKQIVKDDKEKDDIEV